MTFSAKVIWRNKAFPQQVSWLADFKILFPINDACFIHKFLEENNIYIYIFYYD